MAIEKFDFNSKLNTSLQVGDKLWSSTETNGVLGELVYVGKVINIINQGSSFSLEVDVASVGQIPVLSYILFEKDIRANESSLKGYYADVTLTNSSKKRAELFAINSEVVPSSK
mgnify:CR=1 FL=1|tara:strand:- start:84 stop:425 length:342 start_codon:yes stop_codon:yes gene_type:complete